MKLVVVAILCVLPIPGLAAGSAERGSVVFKKCAACHNIDKPENKIGPHLVGIVGRKAGSVETYTKYSETMKKAGTQGIVWNDENLAAYLTAPKKFLPGNRMPFTGLKSQGDVADLLEYLRGK